MAHTPGPWKYLLGRGATPRFHVQTEGGYQIASTTELTTRRTAKLASDFDENAMREANARLIAAAPELLAFLVNLRDLSNAGDDVEVLAEAKGLLLVAECRTPDGYVEELFPERFKALFTAIAKAEGT